MKLQVGKSYRNRKGNVITICEEKRSNIYKFYSNNGQYFTDNGEYSYGEKTINDLIEEVATIDENTNSYPYPTYSFYDKTIVKINDKVKFLDQQGTVVDILCNGVKVNFNHMQTLLFNENRKLFGFDNENLLEIVKDEYQVLYRNNHNIYNTTTTKVNTMKEAIELIENVNELVANPKIVIGLIDENGKVIYKENV